MVLQAHFFSFTDIWGHRSYRKFLSDNCTACRCALLYARRTAPRRHTATRAIRMRKMSSKNRSLIKWISLWPNNNFHTLKTTLVLFISRTCAFLLRFHSMVGLADVPQLLLPLNCQKTQELIQTDGSHPSFFSRGISLLLSFSKTSCNASIWQSEQHKHTPCSETGGGNQKKQRKNAFEMHKTNSFLKSLTRSFSCWVLMGKSEERVSSEESSALASRSHAQQQQVTTTRRVRALTMVLEGCVCSGWGMWKCPAVPSWFIGWHQQVSKIFMAISWHGWHRSAPLYRRLNDDVMNG